MAELADAHDLGSCGVTRGGSSPLIRTNKDGGFRGTYKNSTYESTYHELVHLYPKVSPRGVILVDDYGHFQGAREGTDKYFNEFSQNILLHRIDYTCRVGIKH